eukprot:CAMPEP_0113492744 /NCGR_PEP_ID=MMETSP0014_2-20120614/28237_1 /TAXON_ID=2857 /ORGANISM="Nitzschia sp." /LENGTH=358 /DNA_ID=CAMNT_0000386591 /DNA_START=611 /DNA_END=1687 /DNA_ORIENTATION=+ /assembly_acc=CAM_ASM_000159
MSLVHNPDRSPVVAPNPIAAFYERYSKADIDYVMEHVLRRDLQAELDSTTTAEEDYRTQVNDSSEQIGASKRELLKVKADKHQSLLNCDSRISEVEHDFAQKKTALKDDYDKDLQHHQIQKKDIERVAGNREARVQNEIDHYENKYNKMSVQLGRVIARKEALRYAVHPQSSSIRDPYKTAAMTDIRIDMKLENFEKIIFLSHRECVKKIRRAEWMGLPEAQNCKLQKGSTPLAEYQSWLLFLLKFEETIEDARAVVLSFDVARGVGAGRRIKRSQAMRLQELEAEKDKLIREISQDQDGEGSVSGGSVTTVLSHSLNRTKRPFGNLETIEGSEDGDGMSDLDNDDVVERDAKHRRMN